MPCKTNAKTRSRNSPYQRKKVKNLENSVNRCNKSLYTIYNSVEHSHNSVETRSCPNSDDLKRIFRKHDFFFRTACNHQDSKHVGDSKHNQNRTMDQAFKSIDLKGGLCLSRHMHNQFLRRLNQRLNSIRVLAIIFGV